MLQTALGSLGKELEAHKASSQSGQGHHLKEAEGLEGLEAEEATRGRSIHPGQ